MSSRVHTTYSETRVGRVVTRGGMFDIELTLHLTDGTTSTMSYYLRYTLPEDTGDNYADVSSR